MIMCAFVCICVFGFLLSVLEQYSGLAVNMIVFWLGLSGVPTSGLVEIPAASHPNRFPNLTADELSDGMGLFELAAVYMPTEFLSVALTP